MKIATWNINSITSRINHVLNWSIKNEPDVLCLQETKLVDAKFPVQKLRSAGFQHFAYHGESAYNGVAILSKYPLTDIVKGFPGENESEPKRLVSATVRGIRVVNAYFPHGTQIGSEKFHFKIDWVNRLRKYFDENYSPDDDVLLCGDTNICPHEIDLWNVRYWVTRMHFTKPERESLHNLKRWGFVDVFRQMNDQPGEYTWWDTFRASSFPKNRGLRLDHIWASQPLAERCIDCWIDREPRGLEKPSDHAPVVAEFV
ncbi:MAG: exodeoxyribonuclease III [Pyrinomonadaceae bacterium]